MQNHYFTNIDTVLLTGTLLISTITGIYCACKERNNKSTSDSYFHGNRKSPPIVVGMSLALTFLSGMTTIGLPVMVYLDGNVWFWILLAMPAAVTIASIYYIPFFYKLKLNCVYEYLELRFNKAVRLLTSFFIFMYMMMYMSVTMCYPALALAALTPISMHVSLILTCCICTFYTVFGGFLSVIWTDAFQAMIMFVGCIAVFIQAMITVGGPSVVLEKMEEGGRNTLWNFDLDPRKLTAWSMFFGNFLAWSMVYGSNQADVQRYVSCRSVWAARRAVLYAIVPQTVISFIALSSGLTLYAHFQHCDPLLNNEITLKDQMLPLLAAKLTNNIPGLLGLFVSTIYCGTLSTVSSGINSMTLVLLEDFIGLKWKNISDSRKMKLSKIIGVAIGIMLFV